jgi:NitT/TauT family transport system substrate-binding protein
MYGLTGMAVAAAVGGAREPAAAEPPPETTRIRVAQSPAICFAPPYVAGDSLLQAEGFTDVQYVRRGSGLEPLLAGDADLGAADIFALLAQLDKGQPIVALSGLHVGCYELFVTERIRSVGELRGKTIAIPGLHTGRHLLISVILAHVGIDPGKEVTWVTLKAPEAIQLLADGKVDAFLGFPPEPQELRARKIGRLLVSTTTIDPGRSTSAASWWRVASSPRDTRWPPSGPCAPS